MGLVFLFRNHVDLTISDGENRLRMVPCSNVSFLLQDSGKMLMFQRRTIYRDVLNGECKRNICVSSSETWGHF